MPQRIVSLSPTHTETLFAIGAGDQVIAVDDQSNYPAEAAAVMTDLSGYTPNVEAIAGYEPDLVVTSGDDKLTAQLEALGLDGVGRRVGDDVRRGVRPDRAARRGHRPRRRSRRARRPDADRPRRRWPPTLPTSEAPLTVFHELSADGYSASSTTFIGQVYALFGLRNIADAADDGAATRSSTPRRSSPPTPT